MPVPMKNGKDYFTVVERMDMLIKEQGKENYSLETEVKYESGIVIVKAILTLFVDGCARLYCGHALGELGKAKTLEATETHAIGRALSSAGFFGSEFASANEMESYQKEATKSPPAPPKVKLKDQLVKADQLVGNDLHTDEPVVEEKIVKDKDGNIWDGTKKITFGTKHKDVIWKECLDASYITWVADKSVVDWQRENATCELQRRGLR